MIGFGAGFARSSRRKKSEHADKIWNRKDAFEEEERVLFD